MKTDLKNFLKNDDYYFSEGHLCGWFKSKYEGQTKEDIKFMLESEHDTSLEIENAESELGRNLTDAEKEKVEKRFNEAVLKCLRFKNSEAIGFKNSLEEIETGN